MLGSRLGEAFGIAGIGRVENLLPLLDDLASPAVMQHLRGEQGDAAVMMLVVVPGEELLAKGAGIFDGAEALGEFRPVLEGFELALQR